YNMRRMRKEGDELVDYNFGLHPVLMDAQDGSSSVNDSRRVTPGQSGETEVTRALILFLMNYRSSMKEGYARFETTFGYAGNGIYASATYFISSFIGLNFQYIYYPSPEDWQSRSLFFFSPVLRFNLY
ncbi:MAG: hypothetical protein GXO82_03815, partial [Chlorobi bacterium]|nr:hypothetical protein [Chlorobiota bacterium]